MIKIVLLETSTLFSPAFFYVHSYMHECGNRFGPCWWGYFFNFFWFFFCCILCDLIFLHLPFVHAGQSNKKTARGLFRSLFCCFSKTQRSSTVPNGSTVPDGRISPPVILGSQFLLPPVRHQDMHKKCMVIDLDETLVHSSFKVNCVSLEEIRRGGKEIRKAVYESCRKKHLPKKLSCRKLGVCVCFRLQPCKSPMCYNYELPGIIITIKLSSNDKARV